MYNSISVVSFVRVLSGLTVFILLFPYVNTGSFSDIQLHYVFFAIFLWILNKAVIVNPVATILFAFLFFTYSAIISLDFNLVYPMVGFLLNFVLLARINYGKYFKYLMFGFLVYLFIGFIQYFYDREFAGGLVYRNTEAILNHIDSGRGVRSLTPEPSDFAAIIFFFNIVIVNLAKISDYNKALISIFLLFASFLAAGSLYTFVFHFLGILIYLIINAFYTTLFLLFAFFYTAISLLGSRIVILLNSVVNDHSYILSQGAFQKAINFIQNIRYSIHQIGIGSVDVDYPAYTYGGLSYLIGTYSFLGLIYIIYLFFRFLPSGKPFEILILYLSYFLFVLNAGSLLNPLWIIVFSTFVIRSRRYE